MKSYWKMIFVVATVWTTSAHAETTQLAVDGTEWYCSTFAQQQYYCVSVKGEHYEGLSPLTSASLKSYHAQIKHDEEQAACVCSRATEAGASSSTPIICTGAFDPYLLRKRPRDPCAGAWVH